jgi:hypothetical protein
MRLVPWQNALSESLFAFSLLEAAGYRQGASHAELWRLRDNQNLPVEVGFRLPGLITAVSAAATGRDQVDLTLDSVIDPDRFHRKASSFEGMPVMKSAAVVFLAAPRAGLLENALPLSAIQSLRSYHSSAMKATRRGERLARTVDLATIVGWVALCHEDASVIEEDIAELQAIEKEITVVADETEESRLPAISGGSRCAPDAEPCHA